MNFEKIGNWKAFCLKVFPSPTGVNYYEFENDFFFTGRVDDCFRPQQGLTIMNASQFGKTAVIIGISFRPQQGLTIMNIYEKVHR